MNGEGERGLLGVLNDNTGITDLLGHRILVLCRLKNRYLSHNKGEAAAYLSSLKTGIFS